jgi:hypothetical protein
MSDFNMSEHFLGSNKGFEISANNVQNPLPKNCSHLPPPIGPNCLKGYLFHQLHPLLPLQGLSRTKSLHELSKLLPTMCFDTDSFLIGVNTFASVTMATQPEHFVDLVLSNQGSSVEGIQGGLVIEGHGTSRFNIKDDNGNVHQIKIPNSMFIPDLKYCLLLPQPWAQEAKDKYPLPQETRMADNDEAVILIWGKVNTTVQFSTVKPQILLSYGWLQPPILTNPLLPI